MAKLCQEIAQSIATMEGFAKPGTLAQRNHNPGNLRSAPGVPTVTGYAVFETDEDGWAALYTLVQQIIDRNVTMYEFFAGQRDANGEVVPGGYPGYAPSADSNNPREYALFVAGRVGINAYVPLNHVTLS